MGKHVAQKTKSRKRHDEDLAQTDFSALTGRDDLDIQPEDIPRSYKQTAEPGSLPIIVDGKVRHVKRRKVSSAEEPVHGSEDDSTAGAEGESEEEQEPELAGSELKEYVALYADLITSEPEANIAKLSEMVDRLTTSKKTRSRELLIMSLLPIFQSIIPGYRITELSDAQQSEKVSKEVREVRDFEQGLLRVYKKYVNILHHCISRGKSSMNVSKKEYRMGCVGVTVVCELLESKPHFNLRQELLVSIIEKLGSKKIDTSYIQCLDCLRSLFEQDDEGHVSFEAVQSLTKMIRQRRYKVDSRVLNVFTSLRLLSELQGRADLERLVKEKPISFGALHKLKKKDRVHLTRTERKARQEQKEIDEEMRKAELGVSAQVKERLQAQTLKLVFVLYMNVLKLRAPNLLSPTLEGLAKYAHLVNSELFNDLLEVLREILVTDDGAGSPRQRLLCIYTAFQLLKGQGTSWEQSTDLGFFVDQLYQVLGAMSLNPLIEQSHKSLENSHAGRLASETDMMVRCLELLFLKRRSVTKMRLLAFTKRLAECSIQFSERSSLIALKVLAQILKEHPEARALFTNVDRIGRGRYDAAADVPEQANAEVSTVWEASLLKKHHDPRVQESARMLFRIQ